MALLWVRPAASPVAAPNWITDAGESWLFWSVGVPSQYAAERPAPLFVGSAPADQWRWLDPVHAEYRDGSYPLMGSWPPPQDAPSYADWLAHQRQWMPYETIAYSGIDADTPCSGTLGLPLNQHYAQWLRFNWASATDWPFVTTWSGIRVVAQVNKHRPVTNEGSCSQVGPARLVVGLYKHSSGYPALPVSWNAANFVSVEYEFNNFGVGNYVSPYGAGIANVVTDFATPPGGGAWTVGEQDRYWVIIGQTLSTQGNPSGNNNQILALRKVWAAADATLGGSPAASSPNTGHIAVVG